MDLLPFLIFSGCLCAGVFSVTLLVSKTNQFANRFLAAIIVALGINLVMSWALSQSYFNQFPWLHLLPYGIGFGLGPLIYFYIMSLASNQQLNYWHLLWILADYVHSIYHWIYGRVFPDHLLHEIVDKLGSLSLIVIACYLWISRKVILQYQAELRQKLSNIEQQTLNWLNQFSMILLGTMLMALVHWVLVFTTDLNVNSQLVAPSVFVIVIYWLGIGGLRQPEIVARGFTKAKQTKQGQQSEIHLDLLVQSMEKEKLYLLNDLNVRYLEDKLNLTAKQISEALNQGLGKNFYSFINEYRVEEFKSRVATKHHLTMVGIALECGFSSKTTFQRVFKEMTGMRPSEYLKSSR
ncbi:MAG: AraC family transcriptional regulator [Roseivirga sp.]|nr:AraC family transcriptional regulator [Roseivirga sp.]